IRTPASPTPPQVTAAYSAVLAPVSSRRDCSLSIVSLLLSGFPDGSASRCAIEVRRAAGPFATVDRQTVENPAEGPGCGRFVVSGGAPTGPRSEITVREAPPR